MDVRSLKYFLTVYECRSISGAAKRCYIAQPSISAAIQQLEEHLEIELFTRHARGVEPTDAAHQLLPYAQQLTGDMAAISNLFRERAARQPFRLGLIRSLGAQRMGELLRDFSNGIEDIELTLVPPDAPCDARIVTSAYLTKQEAWEPIWKDEYLLAVPSDHPLGLNAQVKLAALDKLPFIYRTPCEAHETLLTAMRHEKLELDIRARIQTLEYAQAMVQAGIGSALIPDIPYLRAQKQMRFVEVAELNMVRTIGFAYPASQAKSETYKALLNVCRQARD